MTRLRISKMQLRAVFHVARSSFCQTTAAPSAVSSVRAARGSRPCLSARGLPSMDGPTCNLTSLSSSFQIEKLLAPKEKSF